MNGMIDYIGSLITGGFVFVTMLGFYLNVGATAVTQTFNSSVQENMTSMAEIIEYDFRKIGYRVSDSIKISRADSNSITLRQDFRDNGTVDSVQYFLSELPPAGSQNLKSRVLYRRINGLSSPIANVGVTHFRLWYFDASGAPTTNLARIRNVKLALGIESNILYEGKFSGAYWERTFRPQNMR